MSQIRSVPFRVISFCFWFICPLICMSSKEISLCLNQVCWTSLLLHAIKVGYGRGKSWNCNLVQDTVNDSLTSTVMQLGQLSWKVGTQQQVRQVLLLFQYIYYTLQKLCSDNAAAHDPLPSLFWLMPLCSLFHVLRITWSDMTFRTYSAAVHLQQ